MHSLVYSGLIRLLATHDEGVPLTGLVLELARSTPPPAAQPGAFTAYTAAPLVRGAGLAAWGWGPLPLMLDFALNRIFECGPNNTSPVRLPPRCSSSPPLQVLEVLQRHPGAFYEADGLWFLQQGVLASSGSAPATAPQSRKSSRSQRSSTTPSRCNGALCLKLDQLFDEIDPTPSAGLPMAMDTSSPSPPPTAWGAPSPMLPSTPLGAAAATHHHHHNLHDQQQPLPQLQPRPLHLAAHGATYGGGDAGAAMEMGVRKRCRYTGQ